MLEFIHIENLNWQEATWEFPNSICSCFPEFVLEDKANFTHGDIDRNHALKLEHRVSLA